MMKPNEYPITTPSHKNHLSLFSSFKGFVHDSSSRHGTWIYIPHSKLLLAKKFGSFMVSIWPPTGILLVSLLLLTSKTDNCCCFAINCGIKPDNLFYDYSKLLRLFKSPRLIGTFLLGSKDLGFYVFRTLMCIVGKPWSKQVG